MAETEESRTPNLPARRVLPLEEPRDQLPFFLQPGGAGTDDPSIREILKLLRAHGKLIAACVVAFVGAAVLYVCTATKLYSATAVLDIRGSTPLASGTEVEKLLLQHTKEQDYVKTQVAKLSSLSVADEVLSRDSLAEDLVAYFKRPGSKIVQRFRSLFGIDSSQKREQQSTHHRYPDSLLQNYSQIIAIAPIKETSLVEVAATTSDPALAQRLANGHAEGFIEHLRKERQENLLENLKFLEKQGEALQTKVTTAEQNLAKYAEDNELISLSKGDNLVLHQISAFTELLTQTTAKRIKTETLLNQVRSDPQDGSKALDDESTRSLRLSITQAQAEYADMGQRLMPQYPSMVQLRAKISSLEETLDRNRETALNGLQSQYSADLDAERMLGTELKTLKERAYETSRLLVQYNSLQREYESLKDLHQAVLRQLKESQISAANSETNISVSDYAPLPLVASSPRKGVTILLALVCGLIIGVGSAFVLESLDTRLKTPEDVYQHLNLPLLGTVPNFESEPVAFIAKRPNWFRLPLLSEKESSDAHPVQYDVPQPRTRRMRDCVTLHFPRATASEAFRTIRANILLSSAERPPRILIVTSAVENEGKTTLASNLAVTLAQAQHRTILIDADMRRPRIHERFPLKIVGNKGGLVECLAGQTDLESVIVETEVENLCVIPAGKSPPNPSELIGSRRMAEVLLALSTEFDFVLLDCPPVLPVADALVLSRAVEGVILVVRSDQTERQQASEAIRQLRRVNAPLLGVVVNGTEPQERYRTRYPYENEVPIAEEASVAVAGNSRIA